MKTILRTTFALSFLVMAVSFSLIKTQLSITVRDELGNTVEGAKVTLYKNEDDYTKEINPIIEGVTDYKGIIKFKELNPVSYFVIVRKGDKDNSGAGEQTGKLDVNRINKVTIIIQ